MIAGEFVLNVILILCPKLYKKKYSQQKWLQIEILVGIMNDANKRLQDKKEPMYRNSFFKKKINDKIKMMITIKK